MTIVSLMRTLRGQRIGSPHTVHRSNKDRGANKRLRVAIVYHFFPHYRKGVLDAISNDDFDVTFFGDPMERYQGIPSLRFEADTDFRPATVKVLNDISFQWAAVHASLSSEFDVLVLLANPNFFTTWLAAAIGRLTRKRVLFWGHGFLSADRSLKNYIRRIFFSLGHAQYLYGYRAKCIAESFGFHSRNLYVGFNSLDYQSQLRTRRQLLACPEEPRLSSEIRILGVSRLTDKCAYDVLMNAVSLAQETSEWRFKLTLIGGGPAESKLKALAVQLKLDIDFVGELYDEEAVAGYIFDSDVVVSPGKIGLTAMHSLMFGTPVISHSDMDRQMPEVEAVAPGISGILFRYGDMADLSRCLISIPDVFHDRRQTRENCFRIIDEIYNPYRQCEVLSDAIHGKAARRGNDMQAIYGDANEGRA
ncbi:glycosyltransferase [Paraburkholderia madseniana]|uniref:glycosyltransferase n=1 Tax=Paraburkholderia madseniana TaxID=2599607 RepID=UPI0015589218|nr:glycosyltransferase [Paraburkholderia madseniana]NPT63975.1 glycosyltransferase [Paraburkholderia madseniana]